MADPNLSGLPEALVCVVTDDDALSRRTLEGHVAHTPYLTLAASLADGVQLLDFLQAQPRVDVLFLDVQMPQLTGLEVIRLLPGAPAVVLTTARADFAVEAFELRVVDYLVKPIEYPRFLQAVERVQERRGPSAATAPAAPAVRDNALFVKAGGRLTRVPYDGILYVEAVNEQTVVTTSDRQHTTSQMLRDVALRLPEPQFVRVHRSFVVNRRRIESVEDGIIVMEGGRRVPVGRTYLPDFMASLPQ